ncbi:MAG: hypothetical protein EOO76_03070 [Novosphingobium sp.]|nr:MAG: hypothetical protein EOO76_03070 [Novosphingobium sp.]
MEYNSKAFDVAAPLEPSRMPDIGHAGAAVCASAPDRDALVGLTVRVPHRLDCLPHRYGRVGGRTRIHPTFREMTDEVADPLSVLELYGAGVVKSVSPPMEVTFHKRVQTFCAFSLKARLMVSGTGPHEFMVFADREVDPDYHDVGLQTLNISWKRGNSYTLDNVAAHVTKGVVAAEVKASPSYFAEPGYLSLMANTDRTLGRVGISFERIDGTTMQRNRVRMVNVRAAYCDRFTVIGESEGKGVADALAGSGSIALARIEELLTNGVRPTRPVVHAMLCGRHLSYDLNAPLHRDTEVTSAPAIKKRVDIRSIALSEPE